jgi:hypothetical protein
MLHNQFQLNQVEVEISPHCGSMTPMCIFIPFQDDFPATVQATMQASADGIVV